jgi:hypothetical protein
MKVEFQYLIIFLTIIVSIFMIMMTGKNNDNAKK